MESETHACSYVPCTKTEKSYTFTSLMKGFISEHKKMFILFIGILVAVPFKDVLLPHLVGKLYNSIKQKDQSNFRFNIALIVGIVIVVQIVSNVSDYIRTLMMPMIQKYVRDRLMTHIMQSKATNYDEVHTGIVVATMMKLPVVVYNVMDRFRYTYIPALVTMGFAVIYFIWIDRLLGLVLLVIVLITTYVIYDTLNGCMLEAVKHDELLNSTHDKVDDVLRNMMSVMSGNTLDYEMKSMDQIHEQYMLITKKTLFCSQWGKYIVIILCCSYFVFLTWYGFSYKPLETGKFISALIIFFITITAIFNVMSSLNDQLLKWGIIQNSLAIFDTCDQKVIPYDKHAIVKTGILFQDVWFSYETGRTVFKNLTLHIHLGEITIIEGENGSGKSTLIQLLLKYHRPQCGEIFINGVPYSSMSHQEIRQHIAFVPQTSILLNRTIYENIVYGNLSPPSKEEVEDLMKEQQLEAFLGSLPKGLDSEVGMYGSYLSGGQRQIVWILKTMLMDPDILILDEPTAAIDQENKVIVLRLLDNMLKKKTKGGNKRTAIMITHDPDFKNKENYPDHKYVML